VKRLRIPLYVQLLAWLALNLVLIGVLFYAFAAHNQTGWNRLLTQSVRDRLEAIGQRVAADLYDVPESKWPAVLAQHAVEDGVQHYSARRLGPPPMHGRPPDQDFGPPQPPGEPLDAGPPALPDQDLAGRGGPPGPDSRPRFIDIRRAPDGAGFDVRIDASPPARGGPPRDLQLTARVADTRALLQLLGIGHEIAFLGAILLLSALLWWPFVWRMTRTIQQLLHATQQMSQGRLEVRVSETRRDELGELAVAVNSMAERLHAYLQGQRQFIADVAHEVISPIARMQIGLGILETHVPEKGTSALFDVREDLEQMAQMLDELLMFSRSGMESERTPLVGTPLRSLVEKVVATEADGATVSINIPPDMQVKARPAMLERALSNLVRNSRRYAATETDPIELVADHHGSEVRLSVRDRGPGVPESALARLGEPFFRPELSRTRATGGFGLGLAIVRRCVAACNGEVRFRNRPGGGFEAEITLPEAT
jgi:two-component system sensor histidine kinase CpxA